MIHEFIDLIILAVLLVLLYEFITSLPSLLTNIPTNLPYPTFIPRPNSVPQNQVTAYVLTLINNDRHSYGLSDVYYSNVTSAQQHSDNMLRYAYLSHWDTYGLKPYMRYTVLGGRASISENVAYVYKSNGVNVLDSLRNMEYQMVYNDSYCCNNGHKYNILNPAHNEISIGVSYNLTTIYFTEDFVDYYINWVYDTPNFNNNIVSLKGQTLFGYNLSSVEVTYDAPLVNMSVEELRHTFSYGYGQTIAGIGYKLNGRNYYFPNLTTIYANTYVNQGNNFDVEFDISSLAQQYGSGEYTVIVWVINSTNRNNENLCTTDAYGIQHCNNFIAASYTLFLNGAGQPYIPTSV